MMAAGPYSLLDRREPLGHQPEGLVPGRLAEAGKPRAARRVLDQRRGEPVGMVDEIEGQPPFHAQIGLVERLAARRLHADDPAVGHPWRRSGSPFRSTGTASDRGARLRRTRAASARLIAPVGQTVAHPPQCWQWVAVSGLSKKVAMWLCAPRPTGAIAPTPWLASQYRQQRSQRMHRTVSCTSSGSSRRSTVDFFAPENRAGVGPVFGGQFLEPRVDRPAVRLGRRQRPVRAASAARP